MFKWNFGFCRPSSSRLYNQLMIVPTSDTCNKCNSLNNRIKYSENTVLADIAKIDLELHHRKFQKAGDSKRLHNEFGKNASGTVGIAFDLQQTLCTPLLTTDKVYYLRQLWT